jgi:hypothetical protein
VAAQLVASRAVMSSTELAIIIIVVVVIIIVIIAESIKLERTERTSAAL